MVLPPVKISTPVVQRKRSDATTLPLVAWTPAIEDGFADSELAERSISLDRIHAAQQCPAHVALGGNDRFGAGDRFLGNRLRYDDHAVAVAEKVIAGHDGHGADRDRLAEGVGDPALDDVGGGPKRGKNRGALWGKNIGGGARH